MNDKLRQLYDALKSNPTIEGLPEDYNVFEQAMADDRTSRAFFDAIKTNTSIEGLPQEYDDFSGALGLKKKVSFLDSYGKGKGVLESYGLKSEEYGTPLPPLQLPKEKKEPVKFSDTLAGDINLTSLLQAQNKRPEYLTQKRDEIVAKKETEIKDAVKALQDNYQKKIEADPAKSEKLNKEFKDEVNKLIDLRSNTIGSEIESVYKNEDYEYLEKGDVKNIQQTIQNILEQPISHDAKAKAIEGFRDTFISKVVSSLPEYSESVKRELNDVIAKSSLLDEKGNPTVFGWKQEVKAKQEALNKANARIEAEIKEKYPDFYVDEYGAPHGMPMDEFKKYRRFGGLQILANRMYDNTLKLPDNEGSFWQGVKSEADAIKSAGLSDLLETIGAGSALRKQAKGEELSEADQAIIDAYGILNAAENSEQYSKAFTRGKGIGGSVAWMEQFALTSGVGSMGSKTAVKLLGDQIKNKIVKNIVGGIGSAVARTPVLTGGYVEAIKRASGSPELTKDGVWQVDKSIIEPIWKAIAKGAYSNFSEAFSEEAGGFLKGSGIGSNIAKRIGLYKIPKVVRNIAKTIGFQPLGELPEEYLATLMETPVMGDQTLKEAFSPENIWETAVQVGLMTGALSSIALPSVISNNQKRANNKELIDIFGRDNISAIRDAILNDDVKAFNSAMQSAFAGKSYSDLQGMSLEKAQRNILSYATSLAQERGARVAQEEITNVANEQTTDKSTATEKVGTLEVSDEVADQKRADDEAREAPLKAKIDATKEELDDVFTKIEEESKDAEGIRDEIKERGVQEELEQGAEERLRVRGTEENRVETGKGEEIEDVRLMDDTTLEKEMASIENAWPKEKNPIKYDELSNRFDQIEKELERRERESIFNTPLDKLNDVLDRLEEKEEKMPNGYGTFIDSRDINEVRDIIEDYLNPEELSDNDIIKDFVSSLRGRPTTWAADGLRLRESAKEASNRGITFETLINKAKEVYTKEGYTDEESLSVVKMFLDDVFRGAKKPILGLPSVKAEEVTPAKVTTQKDRLTQLDTINREIDIVTFDSTLSKDEKVKRLNELKGQLAELRKQVPSKAEVKTESEFPEGFTPTPKTGQEGEVTVPTEKWQLGFRDKTTGETHALRGWNQQEYGNKGYETTGDKELNIDNESDWYLATSFIGYFSSQKGDKLNNTYKNVSKVKLTLKKPFVVDSMEELVQTMKDDVVEIKELPDDKYDIFEGISLDEELVDNLVDYWKGEGYDGIIIKNDDEFGGVSYVVFDKSQIKSVQKDAVSTERGQRSILEQETDLLGNEKEEAMIPVTYEKNPIYQVNDDVYIKTDHEQTRGSRNVYSVRGRNDNGYYVLWGKSNGANIVVSPDVIERGIKQKRILKTGSIDAIDYAQGEGLYQQWIKEGRMTATDAKTIMESANIFVPKEIQELALQEQKQPPLKSISTKEEITQKGIILEEDNPDIMFKSDFYYEYEKINKPPKKPQINEFGGPKGAYRPVDENKLKGVNTTYHNKLKKWQEERDKTYRNKINSIIENTPPLSFYQIEDIANFLNRIGDKDIAESFIQKYGYTQKDNGKWERPIISTKDEIIQKTINDFDFTDTEKSLIQTAIERRRESINPQDIYDFAEKIAKQDNKQRNIEHTAEAINYASKTPSQFYEEKLNKEDGSLIKFVKSAIGNRALGDAQSTRILKLNLNKEWNTVSKKINDAFLKIQDKTKDLDEQARRLLSNYIEYKAESLDDVLGILDYVKGNTMGSISESVYKWGEDKEMAIIKATPWDELSEIRKAVAVNLNEKVYKHPDFKRLKSIVDKKFAQSQGKGAIYESDMGLQWFYLNADYAEAKTIQDKIAKDLGLTWYQGAVGGRNVVIPKPKGWKTPAKDIKSKIEQAKGKVADDLDELMGVLGGIKEFTGAERAKVLDILGRLIKDLAELTGLKGQQLYERLKEELKGKKIPEDVLQEAWDKSGFAENPEIPSEKASGVPAREEQGEGGITVPSRGETEEKPFMDTKLRKTQTNSLIQDETRQQEEVAKIVVTNRDRYEVLHMGNAVDQAKALIDKKGVQGASLDLVKPTKVMLDYPKRNVARLILFNFYSKALIDPSSSDADKTTAYEWINKLQDIIAKENTSAGQGTAMMKIWKEMQPESVLDYVKRKIQESNDKELQKVVEDATIGQRIDDLYNTLNDESKKVIDDILIGKDIAGIKEKLDQAKEPPKRKTVSKDVIKKEQDYRKGLLDQYKKSAKTVSVSAVGLSKEQIELGGNLVASYIREGYYRTQDIVNKLVDDFKSIGVTLAKDKIDDILNQNKDSKQTYKEYLTNIEAKTGVQKGIGKRIDEVIREHWSKKDELKRTLAQKLIDEAGLSEVDASRLEKSILEQFDKMILERSEKQLTKILGTEKIPTEKKKKGVVDKMIDLINMGALDEQLYKDLFAEKFNLIQLTEAHTAEILRLANNVQLASERGWLERDATIKLAKYIYELYPKSKTRDIQDTWIAMAYSNMLMGISTSVLNLTSAGSNMSLRPIRDVTNLSKWLRMFKRAYKGDYDVYNPFGEMFYGPMIRGSAYGFDEAKEVFINGDLNNKYMEDVARKGQFKVQPLERDKYGKAKRFKPVKVKIGNKTYDFNIFNAYKYAGRNLAAQDKFMLSTSYEVELAHILRDKLKNTNLTGKALTKEVMSVLQGERLDMKQLNTTIEEDVKLFKKMTGEDMTQIEKNIRKRELIQEQLPITKEEKAEAERFARSNIFTDDRYGTIASLANAIGTLANMSPTAGLVLKPFVPFTKVVGNVAEYMLDHTPYYGLLRAHGMSVSRLKRLWGNDTSAQMGDVGSRVYYEQMGRAWFGTLTFTVAMLLFMGKDDEDEVEISGGYNQEGFKKRGRENVLPPYTLRIGNIKIPYKNIPSLAIPLALIGNINDAMKSNMNEDELRDRLNVALLGNAVMNSVFMVKDMSFLDGVQKGTQIMSDAISGDSKKFEKIGEGLIKSYLGFLTRPLPQNNNAIQQIWKFFDPTSYSQSEIKGMLRYAGGVQHFVGKPTIDQLGDTVKTYPGETLMPYTHWLNIKGKDERWKFLAKYNAIPNKLYNRTMQIETTTGIGKRKLEEDEFFYYTLGTGRMFSAELVKYMADEEKVAKRAKEITEREKSNGEAEKINGIQEDVEKLWKKAVDNAEIELFRWGSVKEDMPEVWNLIKKYEAYKPYETSKKTGEYTWSDDELYEFNNLVTVRYAKKIKNYLKSDRVVGDKKRGKFEERTDKKRDKFEERTDKAWSEAKEYVGKEMKSRIRKNIKTMPE